MMFPTRSFVCSVFIQIVLVRSDECGLVNASYLPDVVNWTTGWDTDEDSKTRTVIDEAMEFAEEGAILGFKFWVGNYEPNTIEFRVFNRSTDNTSFSLKSTTRSLAGQVKSITVERSLMNWPAVVHCCNVSQHKDVRIRPLRIYNNSLLGWSGEKKGIIDWNEGGKLLSFNDKAETYPTSSGTPLERTYVYQVEYLNGNSAKCVHGIEKEWSPELIETWVKEAEGVYTDIVGEGTQCTNFQRNRKTIVLMDQTAIKASGVLFKVDVVGQRDFGQQFAFLSAKANTSGTAESWDFTIVTESDGAWVDDDRPGKHTLKPAHMMHLTKGDYFGWWRTGNNEKDEQFHGTVRCESRRNTADGFYVSVRAETHTEKPPVGAQVKLKLWNWRFHYRMHMWPYVLEKSSRWPSETST